MNKQTHIFNNIPLTYQRAEWQEMEPKERLRRSWALRKRLKNLEKIHDKKIFPRP